MKDLIQKLISEKQFSVAEILVARKGRIVFHQKYGKGKFFDLASLTKPLCTAFLTLLAVQEKKLFLRDTVEKFFPTKILKGVSLKKILNHTSPLIAWADLRRKGWRDLLHAPSYLRKGSRGERSVAPTLYSDLGYILLGKILEKVYQDDLKTLFRNKIAKPLGIEKEIFFCPRKKQGAQCVFSEKNKRGIVQDRNAFALRGISGHAGLFGTAKAVHRILSEFRRSSFGQSRLISKKNFLLFCKPDPKRKTGQRYFTLGFDTPTQPGSLSGRHFSKNSIGHLGFTGVSFWWDFKKDLWIILLANRLYFGGPTQAFRPQIHDALMRKWG